MSSPFYFSLAQDKIRDRPGIARDIGVIQLIKEIMGNKQGKQSHRSVKEIQKLRKQNQEEKENGQEPIPIRTAPGHETYNVPASTDPLQAAAMQMVRYSRGTQRYKVVHLLR